MGGLTVLRRIRAALPREPIVYFADQAHVPYGDRSPADLRGLLHANIALLAAFQPDAIVMGCNTSCAIAARYGWPPAPMPVLDLIEAAAEAAAASGARRIGVLATTATATSGAYGAAIRRRAPDARVQELAAPALVPLVEAGAAGDPAARDAVAAVCAHLDRATEAIVYGCSHYPLLDQHFAAALGPEVLRLDPAEAQAACAVATLRTRPRDGAAGRPAPALTTFLTNGPLEPYAAAVERLCGPLDQMEEVIRQVDTGRAQQRAGEHLADRVRS